MRLPCLAVGLVTLALVTGAKADEPTTTAAVAPPAPAPRSAAPPAAGLPVRVTVEATSPDPPWKLRIENTGDHPIRVPADVRLLSLELESTTSKGATRRHRCEAPRAMRPSTFPAKRALYLEPGEVYEELFDPRLVCFGAASDALREGTKAKPSFGWRGGGTHRGPFAAEGTDRPAAFAPKRVVTGEVVDVPVVQASPAPTSAVDRSGPRLEREGDRGGPPATGSASWFVDRNVPQLDIYVERFDDAASSRDIVLTIRAVNEGKRTLSTVIRGRMLSFRVDELGPDNQPRRTFECAGQHAPHAVPTELMLTVTPGREVRVPILVAEVCNRDDVFRRPGLYRVTPVLDPRVDGEGQRMDPYVEEALARQSALVRLATGVEPFYDAEPKTGALPAPSATASSAAATSTVKGRDAAEKTRSAAGDQAADRKK